MIFFKVIYKRNLGLTAKQKLLLQVFIAALLAFARTRLPGAEVSVYVPFIKMYVDLGVFYIPFVTFVVVAMVNAVNLTDWA